MDSLENYYALSEKDRQAVNLLIDQLWKVDRSVHQPPTEPPPTIQNTAD